MYKPFQYFESRRRQYQQYDGFYRSESQDGNGVRMNLKLTSFHGLIRVVSVEIVRAVVIAEQKRFLTSKKLQTSKKKRSDPFKMNMLVSRLKLLINKNLQKETEPYRIKSQADINISKVELLQQKKNVKNCRVN